MNSPNLESVPEIDVGSNTIAFDAGHRSTVITSPSNPINIKEDQSSQLWQGKRPSLDDDSVLSPVVSPRNAGRKV